MSTRDNTRPVEIEVHAHAALAWKHGSTWIPLEEAVCNALNPEFPYAPHQQTEQMARMFTRILETQVSLSNNFDPVCRALDMPPEAVRFAGDTAEGEPT